ncbi:MAG: YaiO family outer membrane beta-barrel protein [Pseudomonadota bacterium]
MNRRAGSHHGRCAIVGVWLALGALAVPAAAQPAWQVEAGAGIDHLSSGAPNWNQFDLALRHRLGPQSQVELSLRRTRRSGLTDEELGAAVGLPLGTDWSASLAAAFSPSHRVLARAGGRVELARRLGDGWVASGIFGRRVYEVGGNSSVGVGVERYVDVWRFAAQLGQTRLDGGGGTAASARLQVDRSFAAERGRVGLILAHGRELEGVPGTPTSAADVIDQRVATLALVGIWPLAPAWALSWEASHVRYDDLRRRSGALASAAYQRSGVRLGVRHDF